MAFNAVELTDEELEAANANSRNRGEHAATVQGFIDSGARTHKVALNGRQSQGVQNSLRKAVEKNEAAKDNVRVVNGPKDAGWVGLVRSDNGTA